jgi:catalase
MEGFARTFRLTNAAGETALAKFHWKPAQGVHSLTWEEAQLIGGLDPDFHRRDLYDAIESGAFPEWELGLQVIEDTADQTFEGIDLLDPTKLVPEQLAPVQPVGRLILPGNPTNFFAESEQVAFHTGHLVPGIDATDDPLLAARNFSYLDTQLARLGGPNFDQIPIHRPHVPVNDNHRDGFMQQAVHAGVAPYRPNAGRRLPLHGGHRPGRGWARVPRGCRHGGGLAEDAVGAGVVRRPLQPDTHVLAQHERGRAGPHRAGLYLRARQVLRAGGQGAAAAGPGQRRRRPLCPGGQGLGLAAPEPTEDVVEREPRPVLSQLGGTWPVDGRIVGIVVDADAGLDDVEDARRAVIDAGGLPLVVAAHGGPVDEDGTQAQRTFLTARSVELDAVLVAGCPPPAPDALPGPDAKAGDPEDGRLDPRVALMLQEAYRHPKPIGAWGGGRDALAAAGVPPAPGITLSDEPGAAVTDVLSDLGRHRVWERFPGSA